MGIEKNQGPTQSSVKYDTGPTKLEDSQAGLKTEQPQEAKKGIWRFVSIEYVKEKVAKILPGVSSEPGVQKKLHQFTVRKEQAETSVRAGKSVSVTSSADDKVFVNKQVSRLVANGFRKDAAQEKVLLLTTANDATRTSVREAVTGIISETNYEKQVGWATQHLVDKGYDQEAALSGAKAAYEVVGSNIGLFQKRIKAVTVKPLSDEQKEIHRQTSDVARKLLREKGYKAKEANKIIAKTWSSTGNIPEVFISNIFNVKFKSPSKAIQAYQKVEVLLNWLRDSVETYAPTLAIPY